MAREYFCQRGLRSIRLSRRVQCDAVRVSKASVVRLQRVGALQFIESRVVLLQANQREPERIVQRGILRRDGEPLPKGSFAVRVEAKRAIQIGEIHVCGNEEG